MSKWMFRNAIMVRCFVLFCFFILKCFTKFKSSLFGFFFNAEELKRLLYSVSTFDE